MSGRNVTRRMLEATEIPADELAVRIAEAYLGLKRPPGQAAWEVLRLMGDDAAGPLRAAGAALEYITECINNRAVVQ